MQKKQHSKPCNQCPWTKTSARGWLGSSTPEEFVAQSEGEARMPCHVHVDYEAENWQAQAQEAPQCAGRAIHFTNRCKMPRNRDLIKLPGDRELVFSTTQEFIEHHTIGLATQTGRLSSGQPSYANIPRTADSRKVIK